MKVPSPQVKPPEPPEVKIPQADDPEVVAARKRQRRTILDRGGRDSTDLAQDSVAYRRTTLG